MKLIEAAAQQVDFKLGQVIGVNPRLSICATSYFSLFFPAKSTFCGVGAVVDASLHDEIEKHSIPRSDILRDAIENILVLGMS